MAKQTFTTGQVLTAAQMTSLQQTAMGGGSPSTKTASYVLVAADAGTVIQMNAAGSTTITVNTALFSAGDSVQIQNIGAGVCTITAGTATVNTAGSLALSQWEGGFLYFTSASSAIFFDVVQSSGMTNPMTTAGDTIYGGASGTPTRLAIGSTGQVLTVASGVPSWATPASGGMTLLSTTALSGSSVTISSIDQTYKNLFIFCNNVYNSANGQLRLRLNGDTGSNYEYAYIEAYNSVVGSYTGTAAFLDIGDLKTTSTPNGYAQITIPRYAETELHAIYGSGRGSDGSSKFNWLFNHTYTSTTAISSITILPSTGTMSGGTVYIYGVK